MLYTFLSNDWSGWVLAAVVIAIGLLIRRLFRVKAARYLGIAVCVLGACMAIGATKHLIDVAGIKRKWPAPGKLVDVGGFRLHLFAEGQSNGRPTIVFLPGGHSAGYGLYNLHKALRQDTRSILFDRAGSGWSDPGPFPRRTIAEVEELHEALQRAGERGPFLLVGHSFGGLLAVNFALRHPDEVAGLVLLDATHPDYFVYAGGDWVEPLVRLTRFRGLAQSFGINLAGLIYGDLDRSPVGLAVAKQLADVADAYGAVENQPKSLYAEASSYTEIRVLPLTPLLVRDGDLGNLPVSLAFAAPGPTCGGKVGDPCAEIYKPGMKQFIATTGLSEFEFRRQNDMMGIISRKYALISSNTVTRFAPPGTSHEFPYEAPDFTIQVIREALNRSAEVRAAPGTGSPTAQNTGSAQSVADGR